MLRQPLSRAERRLAASLLVSVLVVAAELRLLGDVPPGAPSVAVVPELPATPELPPLTATPRAEYAVIAERPLFAPDRRPERAAPAEPEAAALRPPEPLAGRWRLTGIVRSGGLHFALLRDQQGTPIKLAAGERLEQWRLEQLRSDRVLFSAGSEQVELELYEPGGDSPRPGRR